MIELGAHQLLRVFAKHDPYWDTGHLGKVVAEMQKMGPPSIQVVEWRGEYFAVEGSHRLCVAHLLGLIPQLIVEQPERHDPVDEQFLETLRSRLPHYSWLV